MNEPETVHPALLAWGDRPGEDEFSCSWCKLFESSPDWAAAATTAVVVWFVFAAPEKPSKSRTAAAAAAESVDVGKAASGGMEMSNKPPTKINKGN